jgi:nucleotide sugar dehydrogenase
MVIGIVGLGVVGSALKYGFEKLGHRVLVHDLKLGTKIEDVLPAEIVFVCVPTPGEDDSELDVTSIYEVMRDLNPYRGVVAIKSTVNPGTASYFAGSGLRIAIVPEFLRERHATSDFYENHELLVIGTDSEEDAAVVLRAHGGIPRAVAIMSPLEAELAKLWSNAYAATLVTFANSFAAICKKLGADYATIKAAMVARPWIADRYLDSNDAFQGFAGPCLPKDVAALNAVAQEAGVDFFRHILDENAKYLPKVPEGMRAC